MTGPAFVDTNVLVYSRDAGAPAKQARAQALMNLLWESRLGRISQQVLQEYYVTVTRKFKPGLPKEDARDDVEALLAWQPLAATSAVFSKAWNIEDRYGLSWWDSLIVASALQCQCLILFSEDMQDGLEIDGLHIRNPLVPGFDLTSL
jgi:predicted nucleic acid-binding protein